MNIVLKLVATGLVTFLVGCGEPPRVISKSHINVKVIEIDPPKHYHVTFQNIDDGKVEKKRIAKRCSNYTKIKVGETYKIEVSVKEDSNKKQYSEYTDLSRVFCPK